jgi:protein-S-isoprenylcysteine O-methyltransferase Ste14
MHKHLPTILFGIELLSLLFIILSGPFIPTDPLLILTQIFALGLIGWGGYALQRKSKFSFFYELPGDATLVTTGPFQIIRHPMYSGILLFALVSILNYVTLFRLIAFLIMALTIFYKLHREEEYLEKRFSHYKKYQEYTKRLIPFVY